MALRRAVRLRTVAAAGWRSASSVSAVTHKRGLDEQVFESKYKPRSLSLPQDSNRRYFEPHPSGFKGLMLKVFGFYSGESRRIRGAKFLYERIKDHAENSKLYSSFGLEKNFRTTHAMLLLHVWMVLALLRSEEKGSNIGQTMYEIFNIDLEKRVHGEGVKMSLLINKWLRELEKNFYGAAKAYDTAMLPTANSDDLARALWRNVFAEDDSPFPSGSQLANVQAFARYVRWEIACLALTDSEDFIAGNISFSTDFEG